jgi:hypothetical protein
MKLHKSMLFAVLFLPGLLIGQAGTPGTTTSDSQQMSSQMKSLEQAIAQQKEAIARQQESIAQQQKQIEALEKKLAEEQNAQARVVDASLTTSSPANPTLVQGDVQKPKESPLSFRIGGADFTPGGFVDFENVFRSTNTTNVAGTNWWAIPFSNTVQGHLSEFRSTGQYSRFNLKVNTKFAGTDVTGFIEFDFNGNDPANVFVTSNSHTDRLRLYWVNLKRGKWEFLGGQSWGLLTVNRVGVSPNSGDVFTTFNEDGNHNVGANFTRASQFRVTWHPNDNFAWAFALENPQQFTGQGAEVVFPTAFNATLTPQFDSNANAGAPNLFPDLISKIAYDSNPGGKHFHWEAAGALTTVKITNIPTFTGATFAHHSGLGGGFSTALNYELLKTKSGRNLRVLANGLWGTGLGRYLIGTGPQAVVAAVPTNGGPCTSAGNCDLAVSMVHSGNGLLGLEFLAHPKAQFALYYGGAYFQRNAFPDLTSAAVVKPTIGFGGVGEANASVQNRSIQEGTIDWVQTFWKNPQYGAVLLITQYSYVTRSPWFVPAGAPKNAHLSMGYVSLRYVLP